MSEESNVPKRVPVDYRYDALNWDFIGAMAKLASYAASKYGSVEQYRTARLEGEKSPMNHIGEHYRSYITGKEHDHFGDPRFHLVAIAYNAMIEYYYHTNFGQKVSLLVDQDFTRGLLSTLMPPPEEPTQATPLDPLTKAETAVLEQSLIPTPSPFEELMLKIGIKKPPVKTQQ